MDTEKIITLVDELRSLGEMRFPDKATEEQISIFETSNGVKLPQGFKAWLAVCDGGEFFLPGGIQLYGVAHKPLIDVADNDAPNGDFLCIGALSNGDPILCKKNSEEILIYNREVGRIEKDETYQDFYSFLKDLTGILGIGKS